MLRPKFDEYYLFLSHSSINLLNVLLSNYSDVFRNLSNPETFNSLKFLIPCLLSFAQHKDLCENIPLPLLTKAYETIISSMLNEPNLQSAEGEKIWKSIL